MRDPRRMALAWTLCLGVLSVGAFSPSAAAAQDAEQVETGVAPASEAVVRFVDWVIATRDNDDLPFVVIDKIGAEVFVFLPDGRLTGAAPALVGLALGDDSVPGIGDRALSAIAPEERTTPAGRFLAAYGPSDTGEAVLWVDYDTAISLHHVVVANRQERRLERLESPSPDDNRITYGCINVPGGFYEEVVRPAFTGAGGIVYVLPETRSLEEVFPDFRPDGRAARVADQPSSVGLDAPIRTAEPALLWPEDAWAARVARRAQAAEAAETEGPPEPRREPRREAWPKGPEGLGLMRPTGEEMPQD